MKGNLSFNIELSTTADPKSNIVSNIGRAIVKKLAVKFDRNQILNIDDLTYLHATETYGRQPQKKRDAIRQGIISNDGCMENYIKLRINGGDKSTSNKQDNAIAKA